MSYKYTLRVDDKDGRTMITAVAATDQQARETYKKLAFMIPHRGRIYVSRTTVLRENLTDQFLEDWQKEGLS